MSFMPCPNIVLRMNHQLVQTCGGIVARLRSEGETVQVGVKDGLAKDAMFPEDH